MNKKPSYSRRNFVKTSLVTSAGIVGATTLSSYATKKRIIKNEKTVFHESKWQPGNEPVGLLFSQIGYEMGYPVRIIVRLPQKEMLPENASCVLNPSEHENRYKTSFKYWGEIWKSHWWVADFLDINEPGNWNIEVNSDNKILFRSNGLKVHENILWDSTIEWSSVDMLERRRHFTGVGAGWQDAGTKWVESPAQSAMIIALEEQIENTLIFFSKFVIFSSNKYSSLNVN